MAETINLYQKIENFIQNKCSNAENNQFIINYHQNNTSQDNLSLLYDDTNSIKCFINKKEDLDKNEKDIKLLIKKSSFELVIYRNDTDLTIIKCILLLIVNDYSIIEKEEPNKFEEEKIIDINNEEEIIDELKIFLFNYIKENLKNNKDLSLEKILLGDTNNNIRFFNNNDIKCFNDEIKKIKICESDIQIKSKFDMSDVLNELNPKFRDNLIDKYLDEMPEEIVNLMKKYKKINFNQEMYLNYINYKNNKDKDKDKEKNNTVIKTNKKDFNFMNKNNVSNCISPQKSLLMNKKTDNQNDARLSLNKNYKNNLQEKIEIPKVFNPKEFKIIKEIGCGSFGKIYKILWDKNKEKYAMKVMFTKSQENMLYMQDKIHLIMDFEEKTNCDGLIKIYGDAFIKKNDEYYYYEIIELAERDWEQEIIMRKKNLNYYSEWELFIIMSQLVKALSLLQKNHITHRDIKIQNILIINKKYKICDFGEARKLAQKGVIVQPARGSELYMSPIQFFGLNQKVMQVQHNTYKSDVFSLGMCILYAATLSDDCLYDIRELTDMNMIKHILESYLYNKYSIGFIRLLLCLLEINEKKRPDFVQLENIISKIKINQ